jgi:hypothetical protein
MDSFHRQQRRIFGFTTLDDEFAARRKWAAVRLDQQAGRRARYGFQSPVAAAVYAR